MNKTKALQSIIKTWEELPKGNYTPKQIESWLEHMWSSVNDGREALGIKRTDRG